MGCASSSLASRLREACDENNLEEVRRLLVEEGAVSVINDADENGGTALHFATGWKGLNKAYKTFDALIRKEAAIGAYKDAVRTALLAYSRFPDTTALVQLLLEHGAQVNQKTRQWSVSPLICAANIGRPSVVSALLSAGASIKAVNSDGSTALHEAAAYGHPDVVSMLLDAGSNIEGKNTEGVAPLMCASFWGHEELVSLLLDAGADMESKDKDGSTALLHAVCNGHAAVISLLLAAGADVEARRSSDGSTALLNAAYLGHAQTVRDLLAAGADVNIKNNHGMTPLICAIAEGYPHIADDILTHGKNVDASAITSNGSTARDIAESKGYTGLIPKLEAAERKFIPGLAPAKKRNTEKEKAPKPWQKSLPTTASTFPLSCLPSAPEISAPVYRPQTLPPTTPSPVAPATAPPVLHPASEKKLSGGPAFHSSWLIPYSNLQLGTELGRGSFAKVYNASWQETDVAVKVFDLPGGPEGTSAQFSASLLAKISAEADLLASIRHPNVVAFLGMCQEPPCVVTENCARGSLFDIIRKAKAAPADAALLMELRGG